MNGRKISLLIVSVALAVVLGCHKTPGRKRAEQEATSPSSRPLGSLSKGNPSDYKWSAELDQYNLLVNRIRLGEGLERTPAKRGQFGNWLRHLPLQSGQGQLHLFDGRVTPDQTRHAAVIDIDTGRDDFQHTGNAVLRLRAEFLYGTGKGMQFKTNSGLSLPWSRWSAGERFTIAKGQIHWDKRFNADNSYASFRRYVDEVMRWGGTASLVLDTQPVPDPNALEIGNVFVKKGQAGNPGAAAIVVDMAENRFTGRRVFLLAGAGNPADQIHILVNPNDPQLSPWYELNFGATLKTPEGTFTRNDLRKF